MDYNDSRKAKDDGTQPKANDRVDGKFARLLPSGNTTAQKVLAPSGPYHVNHFICYFTIDGKSFTDADGQQAAALLTGEFLRNFCLIFSQHNIARAQIGPRGLDVFDGSKTIEFTIGSNIGTVEHRAIGFVHPDWVAMSSIPATTIAKLDSGDPIALKSFHGDTLGRFWSTEVEKSIALEIARTMSKFDLHNFLMGAFPPPLPQLLLSVDIIKNQAQVLQLLQANKLHFLAGSRSWRVGYASARKQFFVETITIERFSCKFYKLVESLHSTRNDILELWDNLLNNFVRTKALNPYRFRAMAPPATLVKYPGYASKQAHIWHAAWQYDDLQALLIDFIAKSPSPAMRALKDHAGLHVHLKP